MDRDEIISAVSRVETKVDLLLERSNADSARITAVEKAQWYHSGAVAFAAAFLLPKARALFGV